MGTLNIWFRGVCVHFHNVAPGIPHRVVLPDASAFQLGMVDVDQVNSVPYFILPHFAVVRTAVLADQERLNVEQVMEHGNIFDGVRLQVANATGDHITYDSTYFQINSITDYVFDYAYADEVVLGGRAACYFDLFSGTLEKVMIPGTTASAVRATITTDGPPKLLATPFFPASAAPPVSLITLTGTGDVVDLAVANFGIDCDSEDDKFDFLLHYLTAKGGIPRRLSQPVPGMPPAPQEFSQTQIDLALARVSQIDFPHHFESPCFGNFAELMAVTGAIGDITVACSDTRYP